MSAKKRKPIKRVGEVAREQGCAVLQFSLAMPDGTTHVAEHMVPGKELQQAAKPQFLLRYEMGLLLNKLAAKSEEG